MGANLSPDKDFPGWTFWVEMEAEDVITVGASHLDGRSIVRTGKLRAGLLSDKKQEVRALQEQPHA
jgi:hypothetical protein